jgi:predicted Zn-dependent protease
MTQMRRAIGLRGGLALAMLLLALPVLVLTLARSRGGAGRPADAPRAPPVPGPSAPALDWVRWGNGELVRYRLGPAGMAFERARELDPGLASARQGLIWIHTLRMERAQALAEFAALAGLRPLDFDLVLLWTQIRCSTWDPEKVIPQLRQVIAADPDEQGVRLTLAEGLRRLGSSAEAIEALAPLGESHPEATAIRVRLAIDQGDLAGAEAILSRGPADHPALAELRGEMALARGHASAAVPQFRRALAARPDDRSCLSGLAQALRLSGQVPAAEPLLQVVHRHDTLIDLTLRARDMTRRDDPTLLRALGAACEALELIPEARAWYDLALVRDPLDSQTQMALYRLRNARSGTGRK